MKRGVLKKDTAIVIGKLNGNLKRMITTLVVVFRVAFRVQPPPQWIRPCYKKLKMHKNTPKINGKNPKNQIFSCNSIGLYDVLEPGLEPREKWT